MLLGLCVFSTNASYWRHCQQHVRFIPTVTMYLPIHIFVPNASAHSQYSTFTYISYKNAPKLHFVPVHCVFVVCIYVFLCASIDVVCLYMCVCRYPTAIHSSLGIGLSTRLTHTLPIHFSDLCVDDRIYTNIEVGIYIA